MTTIERLKQIENTYPAGHPIQIACIRAAYDIECIENLRQADLEELRELRGSYAIADEKRADELISDLAMYTQMILDTINDIQLLAGRRVNI